jgi:hypothetical protein
MLVNARCFTWAYIRHVEVDQVIVQVIFFIQFGQVVKIYHCALPPLTIFERPRYS